MKTLTKSRILPISLSLFALLIFTLSFIRESSHQVQSHLGTNPTPIPQENNFLTVPIHSDYILPSPGILPGNPFYPVKMMRDRFGLLLTTNPNRRAHVLLHYADKRIAAAEKLAESGMSREAISTAIKAEIYLGKAITVGPKINPELQQSFFNQLKQAVLKHEEVIEKLIEISDGESKNQAGKLHQQLDQYRNQIVSLSGAPFGYVRPEDCELPSSTPSALPDSSENEPYL